MGWDEKILQNAIDGCTDQSGRIDDCPIFKSETELQTETDCTKCKMDVPEVIAKEECAGPMDALCGDVKVSRDEDTSAPSDNGKAPEPEPAKPSPEAPPAPTTSKAADVPSVPETGPETKPTDALAAPDNGGMIGNSEVPQAAKPEPTPVIASVPVPAAPAPTQAPAQPPAEAPITGPTTLFRTVSSGGSLRVEEVIYVEQTETVYVTAPAPQKYRRHAHAHHMMKHRRDREHGLLGHKY